MSNLKKHVNTVHNNLDDSSPKKLKLTDESDAKPCVDTQNASELCSSPQIADESNDYDENNGTITSLSIESIDEDCSETEYLSPEYDCKSNINSVEKQGQVSCNNNTIKDDENDALYYQISEQNSHMIDACLSNNESLFDINLNLGDNEETSIKVANVTADGNCLFYALANQLYLVKVDSKQHKQLSRDLRKDVVAYIKKNVMLFEHELKNRLYECADKKSGNFVDDCNSFLKNRLCRNGFWGGAESLKAISYLHEVNIIVFVEGGPCYCVVKFNVNYERSVLVAYRNAAEQSQSQTGLSIKAELNHYDSVCTIVQEDINKCMEKIADCSKKQSLLRDTSVISLNETK